MQTQTCSRLHVTHCVIISAFALTEMNTVKHASGEILTGKLWRKDHAFFNDLPFHTNVPRTDEIGRLLQEVLGNGNLEGRFQKLLIVSQLTFFSPNLNV
jgi:hypothetical protein